MTDADFQWIAFSASSDFFDAIADRIRRDDEALFAGDSVVVTLGGSGYDATHIVVLDAARDDAFLGDFPGSDTTRFPARIRAAATVLSEQRQFGSFAVTSEGPHLVIRRTTR